MQSGPRENRFTPCGPWAEMSLHPWSRASGSWAPVPKSSPNSFHDPWSKEGIRRKSAKNPPKIHQKSAENPPKLTPYGLIRPLPLIGWSRCSGRTWGERELNHLPKSLFFLRSWGPVPQSSPFLTKKGLIFLIWGQGIQLWHLFVERRPLKAIKKATKITTALLKSNSSPRKSRAVHVR